MGILQSIFGGGISKTKVQELLNDGAVVIDVRSPAEFQGGHVVGSRNIPLPEISGRIKEIHTIGRPIILCCASGMRSGQASEMLKAEGIDCVNGGGWTQVNAMIN